LRATALPIFFEAVKPTRVAGSPSALSRACRRNPPVPCRRAEATVTRPYADLCTDLEQALQAVHKVRS
jgi:hypothetical protein